MTAPVPPTTPVLAECLDRLLEDASVTEFVRYARREQWYCCDVGCGTGACETCPCCCAGWCVSGADGIPEDAEDYALWIEIAAEHNPVAAALKAVTR